MVLYLHSHGMPLYLAEGQSYLYRTGAEFLPTIALQFYLILYFSVYKDLISAA